MPIFICIIFVNKYFAIKTIGISYTEARFENYWNWFVDYTNGHDIQLLELSHIKNNKEEVSQCDGIVLTGGVDVLPAISGGASIYPNMPDHFSPERDEFEKFIYRYAKQHKLPVLAICRGMQYINILEGGKVLDDIGEIANASHRRINEDKIHTINIVEGTLLSKLSGLSSGEVNSAHHQAIDPAHLADSLAVNAWSLTEPSIIEGIEFKDKSDKGFMLGVQWHPERMTGKEQNPLSQHIKAQFLKAVREL